MEKYRPLEERMAEEEAQSAARTTELIESDRAQVKAELQAVKERLSAAEQRLLDFEEDSRKIHAELDGEAAAVKARLAELRKELYGE